MTLPSHLFASESDGALYDTRAADWSRAAPLRAVYRSHHRDIATTAQLRATLRAGAYAWPGGYPLYFITSDGAALSFDSVRAELGQVLRSIAGRHSDGWRVVACDINYEDSDLRCDHSGERIPSANGDDSEVESES